MYDIALDLGYRVGRPSAYIGYKPVHDILHFFNIKQEEHEDYSDILLTDDEIQESTPSAYEISNYLLSSYLGTIVNGDLYYFKNQAVNDMERKDDPRVNAITNCKWDEQKFYNTTFYYFLRYELPGINVVTFEGQYEFGPGLLKLKIDVFKINHDDLIFKYTWMVDLIPSGYSDECCICNRTGKPFYARGHYKKG